MRIVVLALALFLVACGEKDDTDGPGPDDTGPAPGDSDTTDPDDTAPGPDDTGDPADADGDGYAGPEDCDDEDASVNPGANEIYDQQDNDCDGLIDDADDAVVDAPSWYADGDGDGYGAGEALVEACTSPGDAVDNAEDCDDDDDDVHPGADEICDGVDNDCDGATTEEGTVSLSDGSGFENIQDAIDASASGDTVSVCEGTFAENLVVTHNLTIVGLQGAAATVVDAGSPTAFTSTVEVRRGYVVLDGLTITGGTGSLNDGNSWGGGIYAGGADGLELLDCIVQGNTADFGGGMAGSALYPAEAIVVDSLFQENEGYYAGGGFLMFHGSFEGAEITANTAPYGGGGVVFYWDVSADDATIVHDNSATDFGGGLMIWDEGEWSGGEITANSTTGSGGGIFVTDISTIADVVVSDNDAAAGGGGLMLDDARVTMTNMEITSNTALSGGAILMTGSDLACDVCDLGEGSGDNDPDDVVLDLGARTVIYEVGSSATFGCSTTRGDCEGLKPPCDIAENRASSVRAPVGEGCRSSKRGGRAQLPTAIKCAPPKRSPTSRRRSPPSFVSTPSPSRARPRSSSASRVMSWGWSLGRPWLQRQTRPSPPTLTSCCPPRLATPTAPSSCACRLPRDSPAAVQVRRVPSMPTETTRSPVHAQPTTGPSWASTRASGSPPNGETITRLPS